MTENATNSPREPSMRHWWPLFIGGFLGPLLAHFLVEWMPFWAAVTIAFFTMWVVVGLVFLASPPGRSWRFSQWVLGGVAGALVAGVFAYFLPW